MTAVAQVRVELLDGEQRVVDRWLVNADRAQGWADVQVAARSGHTARLVELESYTPLISNGEV